MQTYPIQFALPDSKVIDSVPKKSCFFSDLSPLGRTKKYKFYVEREYYEHYAKSFFAVTTKKGGWDCLRHYEILASGSLPYFIDIESCPKDSLFAWPKDLLRAVKELKGMPSERKVLKATKKNNLHKLEAGKDFDEEAYKILHKKFSDYYAEHLSSKALANYFLKSIGKVNGGNILLCFGCAETTIDYMRDTLIAALAQHPSVNLTLYPNPFWHLKSCHRQILNTFYGRGFSCTASLDATQYDSPSDWQDIAKKLNDYDAIVACSSSNYGFSALPEEVQTSLNARQDIIWVDGNDIKGDHSVPTCANLVFRREA